MAMAAGYEELKSKLQALMLQLGSECVQNGARAVADFGCMGNKNGTLKL